MASDWISRRAVFEFCRRTKLYVNPWADPIEVMRKQGSIFKSAIENAPAVDAVEVVRCKNCALRGDPENCPMCAHRFEIVPNGLEFCYSNNTEDDGFCHKGVKKDAVD